MRYKVRAKRAADFARLQQIAAAYTRVFAVSERRLTFSMGELDDGIKERIRQLGGVIESDYRYGGETAHA
jgi:hypothetical protein